MTVKAKKQANSITRQYFYNFLHGWNPPFLRAPPVPFQGTPSFWNKFKKSRHLSDSHPNCCMWIVRNTLKWRCYALYFQLRISSLLFILSDSTLYLMLTLALVRYFLYCSSYLTCKRNENERLLLTLLKGTLMQIWKSCYMFVFM